MVARKLPTQMIARSLAPEDIRRRDYVAALYETWQILPCVIDGALRDVEPISVSLLPYPTAAPYRVVAVCLPFVFVEDAFGGGTSLDVRGVRLVRVGDRYAKRVWQALRSNGRRRCKRRRAKRRR